MEFKVEIYNGEVYIDGNFVAQLCYDSDAIGCAIANWIDEKENEDEC